MSVLAAERAKPGKAGHARLVRGPGGRLSAPAPGFVPARRIAPACLRPLPALAGGFRPRPPSHVGGALGDGAPLRPVAARPRSPTRGAALGTHPRSPASVPAGARTSAASPARMHTAGGWRRRSERGARPGAYLGTNAAGGSLYARDRCGGEQEYWWAREDSNLRRGRSRRAVSTTLGGIWHPLK